MEAKELRIGNYVQKAEFYKDRNYFDFMIDDFAFLDLIEPIPLTEEWLLKFHFSKIGLNYSLYMGIDGVEFIVWTKHYEFQPIGLFFRFGDFDVEIKYVHQLQNLYFALTNEELTIKQ